MQAPIMPAPQHARTRHRPSKQLGSHIRTQILIWQHKLDKIAHYDHEYDYTQTPGILAYLADESGPCINSLLMHTNIGLRLNCEWAGFLSAGGDSDLFLTNLQKYD